MARKYPYAPRTFSVRMWFGPWGDLHYESVRTSMPYPKGGGAWENYGITHNDLLPVCSPFVVIETDETTWPSPLAEAVHEAVRPEGG